MSEYDAIVIGAGYGGATVAALLARQGRRVALIEKTARAGGKTQTTERKGYRFEMFGAVGIPAHNSRFHELVDALEIGEEVPFVVPEGKAASVRYKTAGGEWRTLYSPLLATGSEEELNDLRRVYGVGDEGLGKLAKVYEAAFLLSDEELEALDEVGFSDWLSQFELPDPLASQIFMNMNTLFVVAVDQLAASEAILVMRDQAIGGAGRYHIGGFGRVAEASADYVQKRGGSFLTKTRVERLLVENGRCVGVATAAGELRAPVVVSNAGIQATVLKLAGAGCFPPDYVERVRQLQPSWAIAGFRYILDKEVFDAALIPVFSDQSWLDSRRFANMEEGIWPDVPLIAIDVPTAFDPALSDVPGHQLANCQVFVSADPQSTMTEEAIRRADEVINELWPELQQHILRKEPYGPRQISSMSRDSVVPGCGGEAVGLAQVVGQIGRKKPSARTPLPGLYLVGCDAGGRGAGTHQAVDSGFKVAAMIQQDLA